MLFSVGWTFRNDVQLERRPQMQLRLFDRDQKSADTPTLWKRLRQDERAAVVATLSRLLAKTIRPDSKKKGNHER